LESGLVKVRLVVSAALLAALAGCGGVKSDLDTLRTAPKAPSRATAAERLGGRKVSGPDRQKVVDALVEATLDPAPEVRVAAVRGLAKLGGDEARQALLDVVAGRQHARAALRQYEVANELSPNQPDILTGLARAQTEVGQLKEAEQSWDDVATIVESGDPQAAARQLQDVSFGYMNLRMAYERDGKTKDAERIAKKAARVDEKMKEAQAQGGGGGMFPGMGGSFPGGMPGGFPGGMPGGFPGGSIPIQP
jgi:hypothetical protein